MFNLNEIDFFKLKLVIEVTQTRNQKRKFFESLKSLKSKYSNYVKFIFDLEKKILFVYTLPVYIKWYSITRTGRNRKSKVRPRTFSISFRIPNMMLPIIVAIHMCLFIINQYWVREYW